MKKIMAKLRTGSFWVALAGALTLILSCAGITNASAVAEKIMEGIGSILLLFGIVVSPAAEVADGETTKEGDLLGDGEKESPADKQE